jgi:dolichyl-phosphate-mannose-protein mannosyltransferase
MTSFEEPSRSRRQSFNGVRIRNGAFVLSKVRDRCFGRYREVGIALLLTLLAFAVRVHRLDFNSLSEDEVAKWAAVQEYREGHFVGVNSEHPMVPKMLVWGSLALGERWGRVAAAHGWFSLNPEGWLRLPNVLFGAATAAILYLFCRRMMGIPGSFAASFFWAVAPLPVALNRLTKEETPLTFFTLLACYFYCRAQQTDSERSARRWYDLSAIGFGLGLASQYIVHLLGLNALSWLIAGRSGMVRKPSQFSYKRFFFVMFFILILVNPVILFPSNFSSILHWLHHDGVRHSGYDFDGRLYMNFPSRLLAGVPWFYYLWLLLVKTPIPILMAIIAGSVLLLRDRRTLASCFFLSLGVVQLAGLSVSGAKWIRYSLPLLPFLYLAGGYAVQQTWKGMREKAVSLAVVGAGAVMLFGWPLLELQAWRPFYSFYLNSLGGGTRNITRYFSPDEVAEFDTREVAQGICPFAPRATKVATARPMSMAYYLKSCGRADIQIVPLYDTHYTPRDGDLIVLEPSRRFFETQRFFDVLESSGMPHSEIRVGPVLASTVYLFDPSAPTAKSGKEELALTQLQGAPPRFEKDAQETASTRTSRFGFSNLTRRLIQ